MCFEELVKRISPTLKRITHRLNGRLTFFNDEDLYQEALIHLWLDYRQGKLSDKTNSYILQGCYFYLKNYIRKTQNRPNLVSLDALINDEGTSLEEILCKENPESCFSNIECKIFIEQIQSNGLTKREKEVLSFCLQGLTVREIGKRLGISHVRVVKVKKNLRNKLKECLK